MASVSSLTGLAEDAAAETKTHRATSEVAPRKTRKLLVRLRLFFAFCRFFKAAATREAVGRDVRDDILKATKKPGRQDV